MKKREIAKRLARQAGLSNAEAADQLDRVVHQILSKLRKGQAAPFPGLGRFTPGPKGAFRFEREKRSGDARK
jgi:nucleoid DNA-binding protein